MTEDELAAVIAAVEVVWPQRVVAPALPPPNSANPWRFSGRWWSRPVVGRRERPWRR